MSKPVLDIGVIYTDDDEHMQNLLFSLRASLPSFPIRLWLIDNNSKQGIDRYSELLETTVVLKNKKRKTYSENLNLILNASTAEYVLLLNTDIYFKPEDHCLERMVQFMKAHPQCGLAGCRVYHPDGTYGYPARRLQTLKTVATRRLGFTGLFETENKRYLYLDSNRYSSFECEWLSGCFMMVRREAYQQVGLFDEGFKKYFEDVDYALRMQQAGWTVMFHGETSYLHNEQRASKNILSRDAWLHARSYLRWIKKWGLNPQRHLHNPKSEEAKAA